jgi:hypothetical protein
VDDDRARVRAEAAHEVREALGIEPSGDALFARLAGQVGADEMGVAIESVWRGHVNRRRNGLAAIAAASLAMDRLGTGWWHEARVRSDLTMQADNRSPATLLRSPEDDIHRSNAELLGYWAADDVADHLWGPPAAYVDLNSQQPVDRVPAPENARPGDRLLLAWDPGCRLWAVVEERGEGRLGTRFENSDLLFSPPADLLWSWATATETED